MRRRAVANSSRDRVIPSFSRARIVTSLAWPPYLYFDAGPRRPLAAFIAGREDELPLIGAWRAARYPPCSFRAHERRQGSNCRRGPENRRHPRLGGPRLRGRRAGGAQRRERPARIERSARRARRQHEERHRGALALFERLQPSLRLLVLGRDLQHVLVAALRARRQALAAIEIAEGDEGVDEIRIDRQRALVALRRLAVPLRVALLARAEEVPRLRVIGGELHRLLEQHDRAVIVAGDGERARLREVVLGDRALGHAFLQLVRAARAALQKRVAQR